MEDDFATNSQKMVLEGDEIMLVDEVDIEEKKVPNLLKVKEVAMVVYYDSEDAMQGIEVIIYVRALNYVIVLEIVNADAITIHVIVWVNTSVMSSIAIANKDHVDIKITSKVMNFGIEVPFLAEVANDD